MVFELIWIYKTKNNLNTQKFKQKNCHFLPIWKSKKIE